MVGLFETELLQVPWKYQAPWSRCLKYVRTIHFRIFLIFHEGNYVVDILSKYPLRIIFGGIFFPTFVFLLIGMILWVVGLLGFVNVYISGLWVLFV